VLFGLCNSIQSEVSPKSSFSVLSLAATISLMNGSLATTVIEVGISLPKLSTIVIVGAERMGLATLHQLRGRVSRTGLKGYCYLFTHDESNKRLKEFARTTNGFQIAKLDLKFRKSGDLLTGKAQSGKEFLWLDMGEDEEIVKEAKRRADGR
jgi:ATP-dependent DNA helicase RecG